MFENYSELTKSKKIVFHISTIVLGYLLSIFLITFHFLPYTNEQNVLLKIGKHISSTLSNYNILTPIRGMAVSSYMVTVISLLAISILILYVSMFLGLYTHKKKFKQNKIFGDAKWSNFKQLEKAKLCGDKGIIVGKYKGKLLRFDSQEFASLGAPTRSGKGTGCVIPNLLDWQESIVVQDIKKECYDYTSKYRSDVLGQKVYLFDPFSEKTHRYNPLGYLDFDVDDIELQIAGLAGSLYPTGKGGKDFFAIQAGALFTAVCFLLGVLKNNYLLACSYTLTSMAGALNGLKIYNEDGEIETVPLKEIVETVNIMGLLSDTVYSKFLSFFNQEEAKDQYTGIIGSYEAPLKIFQDPLFENATLENDFDFRNLRKEKTTIYIGITPENLPVAKPILNLFFSQLIFQNIRQGLPDQNADLLHSVLLLMDEFTAIGYMQQYQVSVGFMAGYNMRSLIIYQTDAQLFDEPPLGYGKNGGDVLLENHTCNIIYKPKRTQTAKEISERIGSVTIKLNNRSYNSKDVFNSSSSDSTTQRALILPQEIMALKADEQILFCGDVRIKCNKANYFETPIFIDKLKSVSPTLKNAGEQPNQDDYKKAVQNGELRVDLEFNKLVKNEVIFSL
ncbi:TPA: type IV secretory system conjugative DNA transfer family protein [Providencia rettgeri]|nr:type IV secretory system conjugative DNA transfer family protein [Providencia rettgeri]HEM7189729.1 type IV secretory system conjugative DNA transfer family protein [Providencia rettgeri]